MCCDVVGDDYDDLCVPLLVESSVHMGNDWFWCAVLPLTCVPSGCFWNRASTWGVAIVDV